MNLQRLLIAGLCAVLSTQALAQSQDMDAALSKLADNLAAQIKDHGNKKVTVLDFTDLQGGSSELGRYIAEELSVNLVMGKHDFAVLDRANLKSILAEHKLTAEGLVNPDNAKKLGQFAGVDALIVGNIIPMNSNVDLRVKIITTDTAEIVGAAKAQFKSDDTAQQFLSSPAKRDNVDSAAQEPPKRDFDARKASADFGALNVTLDSFRVLQNGQVAAVLLFKNNDAKNAVRVALNRNQFGNPETSVTDEQGRQLWVGDNFQGITARGNSGYYSSPTDSAAERQAQIDGAARTSMAGATAIDPGSTITVTMTFSAQWGQAGANGSSYQLQCQFTEASKAQSGQEKFQSQTLMIQDIRPHSP